MCGIAEEPALPLDVCVDLMERAVKRADQRLELDRNLIERYRRLRCPRFDCERQPRHAFDAPGHEASGQEHAGRYGRRECDGQQNNRKKIAEDE